MLVQLPCFALDGNELVVFKADRYCIDPYVLVGCTRKAVIPVRPL